jgi:hypothetical protein
MLRAGFNSALVNAVEGFCTSFLRRAAGSLPKPIKEKGTPTIEEGRQAFEGDLRSTSGLGVADGIANHTGKWLQVCHEPSALLQRISAATNACLIVQDPMIDLDVLFMFGMPTVSRFLAVYHPLCIVQGDARTPMAMLREEPPKKVSGLRVASVGGDGDDHPALGCPIEYIDLRGTTPEKPAVCKYTGNKYYSDDWIGGGAH